MATHHPTTVIAEPGKFDVTIIRELDAPRELVFKAYTDPELYVQWLGPKGYKMTLVQFEPRTGGSWKYLHEDEKGAKFSFRGVYHEVTAPSRMIDTFEFEGMPGHVAIETLDLEELPGGRTKVTAHSVFPSVADRDGMVQSGMEYGVKEGFERLDDLLETLNK